MTHDYVFKIYCKSTQSNEMGVRTSCCYELKLNY